MIGVDWKQGLSVAILGLGLGIMPPCPIQPLWFNHEADAIHQDIVIYVYGDLFHTNVLVPAHTPVFNWAEELGGPAFPPHQAENYPYLSFGWGDRELYTQLVRPQEVPPTDALRALFGFNNQATLHVEEFEHLPQAKTGHFLQPIRISSRNYLALVEFLLASFERDDQGKPIWLNQSPHGNSNFYAATGTYSAWNTCNSWTATGLRQAQVNMPPWDTLALPIFYQLSWENYCAAFSQSLSISLAYTQE